MSRGIKLTPKQSNNLKQNNKNQQSQVQPQVQPQVEPQIQPQSQPQPQQDIEQSPNQLVLSLAVQKALEAVRKKRAERSPYMSLEPNQTYTLLFNPAKMQVEQKTFSGQVTERVAHNVTDLDKREAGEKLLSLTYKQSEPIEDIISQGYTVMQVTKMGEGFDLKYKIDPIE